MLAMESGEQGIHEGALCRLGPEVRKAQDTRLNAAIAAQRCQRNE
jgi:hypothetical protein